MQAPESELHALVGVVLGKLGQSIFVGLADRVECTLDSLLGKVHGADPLLDKALGGRLGQDTLDELAVGEQQVPLAGARSLFGRR